MDNCGSNPYKSILKTLLITAIGARSFALKILKASTETQPRNLWVLHTPLQPSVECYPSSSMQLALGESPPVGSLGAGCMDGQYTLIFQVPFIGFGSTPRGPRLARHPSGFWYIFRFGIPLYNMILTLRVEISFFIYCLTGQKCQSVYMGLRPTWYWRVQYYYTTHIGQSNAGYSGIIVYLLV